MQVTGRQRSLVLLLCTKMSRPSKERPSSKYGMYMSLQMIFCAASGSGTERPCTPTDSLRTSLSHASVVRSSFSFCRLRRNWLSVRHRPSMRSAPSARPSVKRLLATSRRAMLIVDAPRVPPSGAVPSVCDAGSSASSTGARMASRRRKTSPIVLDRRRRRSKVEVKIFATSVGPRRWAVALARRGRRNARAHGSACGGSGWGMRGATRREIPEGSRSA